EATAARVGGRIPAVGGGAGEADARAAGKQLQRGVLRAGTGAQEETVRGDDGANGVGARGRCRGGGQERENQQREPGCAQRSRGAGAGLIGGRSRTGQTWLQRLALLSRSSGVTPRAAYHARASPLLVAELFRNATNIGRNTNSLPFTDAHAR